MKTSIQDFKTGWYGIAIGLKASEIDQFIQNLDLLRAKNSEHFHARSSFRGPGGIGDIEFYLVPEDAQDDLLFDYSKPIRPQR